MSAGASRILVVDRLGADLAAYLAPRRPDLELRVRAADEVEPGDVAWADTLLGFAAPRPGWGRIRWVHSTGAGVDALLRGDPLPEGVVLTRSVGRLGERIAEYCLARALYFAQGMGQQLAAQRERRWQRDFPKSLADGVAVVVGTGAMGTEIARAFRGLRARTVGVSRRAGPNEAFERIVPATELGGALAEADWIVLAVPLTAATRGLIDAAALAPCQGAILINVARGAIIVESALLAALDSGRLSAAALDVFETEPLPATSPLWSRADVLISPHVAALTRPEEAGADFLRALTEREQGITPTLAVDLGRGY